MSEQYQQLRKAFSTFMTGVTVVTTYDALQRPRGFTANSFTSVSLEPPLLLICIDKSSDSFEVFTEAQGFAVNVLAESQTDISSLFAQKRADKFDQASWYKGPNGLPLLENICAWFETSMYQQIDAGDHVILMGQIKDYDFNDKNGLGYARGGYVRLALEQKAVEATIESEHIEVSAIVESQGNILLLSDHEGMLQLPTSYDRETTGSVQGLKQKLHDIDEHIRITALYAVYERPDIEQQTIVYRARTESTDAKGENYYPLDDLPWSFIKDSRTEALLKRYCEESQRQRFSVYLGGDASH